MPPKEEALNFQQLQEKLQYLYLGKFNPQPQHAGAMSI